MKARMIQQVGKQNDRLNCRSAKRKPTKSPLKIREKIKELEVKLQQEKKATISKNKPVKGNQQPNQMKVGIVMAKDNPRTPFEHIERDRMGCHSAQKISKYTLNHHPQLMLKAESRVLLRSNSSKSRNKLPLEGPQLIVPKISNRTLATDNEQLTHLKEENQRYKRIYSHSLEKMQRLQAKLQAIRQQHEAQKWQLEDTMQGLKQRIQQKKIPLGHLYTHTQHDFLLLHDCIITQTENQSSSVLENLSKRFQPSSLSIESK